MSYKSVKDTLDYAEDQDDPGREASVLDSVIYEVKQMKRKAKKLQDTDIEEVRERVEPHIAEPSSEEGQEVIHDGRTHVAEVWNDGEITSTKSGDLYRARSIHQMSPPVWPEGSEVLFDVPDDSDNRRMVITNRESLEEVLDEYRE